MKELKRKRRIRTDRLLMLIGACILSLILVFGIVSKLFSILNPSILSKEFAKANMEVKLEDDKVDSNVYSKKDKDSGEKLIYAIHLPKLKSDEANQKMETFVNQILDEKAKVTHIDYESNQAFSQYKSYVIQATTYESVEDKEPLNPIKTEKLYINFDKDELITLEDCVREKVISQFAKKNEVSEDQIQLVKINESGVVMDVNGKEENLAYDKSSFVMNNENIPSLLKYEKIHVEKREIDPTKPMIAFTFDDGPSPGNTERILQALEKVGGRATFFQLGYLMEIYPETVRKVVESGSEVANHSYAHDWLTEKSLEDALADIQSVNDIAFSITGNEVKLVRPPYGAYNSAIKEGITEKVVMWDVDTRDWESKNTESIIKMTKQYSYDGAIVLFHDIHSATIPAVEELITYYDELGYQFVTVSELYEIKGK